MLVPDTRPGISNKTSLEVVNEFVKEHGLTDDCIHHVWDPELWILVNFAMLCVTLI